MVLDRPWVTLNLHPRERKPTRITMNQKALFKVTSVFLFSLSYAQYTQTVYKVGQYKSKIFSWYNSAFCVFLMERDGKNVNK